MKITQYQQMMAYLMRPKFNGGGSVGGNFVKPKKKPEKEVKKRKKENFEKAKDALENPDEVREMFNTGGKTSSFEPRTEKGKALLKYINELPKGSVIDYNKLTKRFNVSPTTVYRALETRPGLLKTSGVEKNKAISEEVKEAYNKLKKELKRNPTKNEVIRATGRNADAIDTAQKNFKLNFFNKPGVSAVPSEISKEARKKATEIMRANKVITEPTKRDGKLIFPNKEMEKEYKDEVRKKYKYPRDSVAAKEAGVLTQKKFYKKFYKTKAPGTTMGDIGIMAKELDLKYPEQTYTGKMKQAKIIEKRRTDLISDVSGKTEERKIVKAKREAGLGRAGENLDLAHRASLKQLKDLGVPYLADNLGLDTRKVNQEILPPLEKEANSLHKQRMKLIKGVEPGNVPKEVSKKLEDINIKLSNISLKTNGALQAILIDEKNLKPFVFNKNYANVIGQGLIDKPVKDLSNADLDFIKATFPQAAETAKKEFKPGMQSDGQLKDLPGGNRKGLNLGLLKGAGETIKAIPTLAGGLALNLAFQPDLSSGVDRAALGAEAAFAPELVRQASRVTSNPIVQRFFNLGLSPQMALRAARIASPIGIATLAGEGLYQAGKYAIDRRKELQSMSPVERDRLRQESDAFSFNEFSAAGGGIAKLAGKSSGRPPESGPTPQGLDFLIKRGRQS